MSKFLDILVDFLKPESGIYACKLHFITKSGPRPSKRCSMTINFKAHSGQGAVMKCFFRALKSVGKNFCKSDSS